MLTDTQLRSVKASDQPRRLSAGRGLYLQVMPKGTQEGVAHVQPPIAALERMLTVRLHLDPADESNGALWVSPRSHRLGRLPASEAAIAAERLGKHLCVVDAGDVLLLRPLTLHASRKATSIRSRRVVHLEFAGVSLPTPLDWAEAAL
jgi:ectoine hydroxylase-related dioxygenase (phytanoyl-CoA dioxygenase family)